MLLGGSAFLGYDLILEFMRHHDETNLRPFIIDHLIATSIISTIGGFIATNSIHGAFASFLLFGLTGGIITHWGYKMNGFRPGGAPTAALIYY